ncbi:MAG: DUF1844 domain-containing protein [Candidatus Omnitrophica bacterium]|nr:DUF1844 domain-containing protein [Candidatus Omnitrophota bacterium]
MENQEKNIEEALKDAGKDFSVFITGLSMQALVSLGEVPNPVDNKKSKNLSHAKYMIDTLDMIKEKTKNNLTDPEQKLLDDVLYQLRMKYLELTKKENA